MSEIKNRIVSIYTEQTPNPENIKFVINQMLYSQGSIDFPDAESVQGQSPFADALFGLESVRTVFIASNFVTIGKTPDKEWIEITPMIKEFIKDYIKRGEELLSLDKISEKTLAVEKVIEQNSSLDDADLIVKIKEILDKYVQPAVAMDGGAIVFQSYSEGIVTLGMQGACSGCPSSAITLKAGIEGMMKRMLPEVKEVVAEAM